MYNFPMSCLGALTSTPLRSVLCLFSFSPRKRRSVLLKKRAEARVRGELEEPSIAMRAKNKMDAAAAAAAAGGIRLSIDGEEAAQVQTSPLWGQP